MVGAAGVFRGWSVGLRRRHGHAGMARQAGRRAVPRLTDRKRALADQAVLGLETAGLAIEGIAGRDGVVGGFVRAIGASIAEAAAYPRSSALRLGVGHRR